MSRKRKIRKWFSLMLAFALLVTSIQAFDCTKIFAKQYTDNGCVLWVRDRARQIGITLPGTGKNEFGLFGANNFWRTLNYSKGNEPAQYALAVWKYTTGDLRNYGHVAFVESVDGNNVTITEGGCPSNYIYNGNQGVRRETIPKSSMEGHGGDTGFLGYIYLKGTPAPREHDPEGWLDSAWTAPGQLTVSGWALDRDNAGKAIKVHIYIGDRARTGSTAEVHVVRADQYRDDVGKSIGCGYYHGFSATINTNKTGNQTIYAYGINIDSNGNDNGKNNPELYGAKSVNIPPKINYSVNTGSASDIKNKKATISGSLSPAGNANSWGFYAGTSENEMKKYTVSASSTNSANMKAQIGDYMTLKPGTKYYYRTWAWVNDQEKKGSVNSFVTTAVKPEIPELKVSADSKDIGIGDAPEFSWKAVDQADYYKLYLYDEDGQIVQKSDKITGTKYAFGAVEADGEYSACIEAYNEVGTKGKSEVASFTVHPDVTVKFMDADSFVDAGDDYEPAVLSEQKVHYGKSATKPADPQHKGYTFSKWVGNYSSVKEDAVVKAEYKINQYKVTYIDSVTNEELGSEKVTYYSAANPVDYTVATGYKKTGYDGWDKDYKHITEDTKLYTCFG